MKKSVIASLVFAAVSFNAAAESFDTLNGRLGSSLGELSNAVADNNNNHQAQARVDKASSEVNTAYNNAKFSHGSDTTNAPPIASYTSAHDQTSGDMNSDHDASVAAQKSQLAAEASARSGAYKAKMMNNKINKQEFDAAAAATAARDASIAAQKSQLAAEAADRSGALRAKMMNNKINHQEFDAAVAATAARDASIAAQKSQLATEAADRSGALRAKMMNNKINHQEFDAAVAQHKAMVDSMAKQKQMLAEEAAQASRYASMKPETHVVAPELTTTAMQLPDAATLNRYSAMHVTTTAKSGQVDTINVSAHSLNPNTQVSATLNGKTVTTTAGTIAKINPEAQISIPHQPALIASRAGGNNDRSQTRSGHEGTGNGSNNAANSHSAHGLGGGSHIGGGSAQNGGFHGGW
ncbi:hypothetical protein [Enterobacter sp.]|uniref:hypothetical protein n=1 Tax=Enterobacter sp. TaxID=42895 RepID=UPI00296EE07A|nr:hypothetical protein [Enterobacter sp.]